MQIFPLNRLKKCKSGYILSSCDRDIAQPGLARLTGGQKVESSNLSVPTIHFPQGTWVFAQVPFFLPF